MPNKSAKGIKEFFGKPQAIIGAVTAGSSWLISSFAGSTIEGWLNFLGTNATTGALLGIIFVSAHIGLYAESKINK